MRRLVVLLTISVAALTLGIVACGGNDKPPLTPDSEMKSPDLGGDAGDVPAAPTTN